MNGYFIVLCFFVLYFYIKTYAMQPSLLIIFLAALVPLIMGFIWYNSKVMGKAWIKSTGLPQSYEKRFGCIQ